MSLRLRLASHFLHIKMHESVTEVSGARHSGDRHAGDLI
jgi:hypothetical protein